MRWDWLLNVTCNDISVIYVMAHRCTGGPKKFDIRSGSKRHRYFVGFFYIPVYGLGTDTGPTFLYGYSWKSPHWVAFYDTLRIHPRLNPRVSTGSNQSNNVYISQIAKDAWYMLVFNCNTRSKSTISGHALDLYTSIFIYQMGIKFTLKHFPIDPWCNIGNTLTSGSEG